MEILFRFLNMIDLSTLNLDQFMIATNSPLNTSNAQTVVGIDNSLDNSAGAVTFAAGAIRVPLTIGIGGNGAYVRLDGTANRIIVNDGTVNRIVIGSV